MLFLVFLYFYELCYNKFIGKATYLARLPSLQWYLLIQIADNRNKQVFICEYFYVWFFKSFLEEEMLRFTKVAGLCNQWIPGRDGWGSVNRSNNFTKIGSPWPRRSEYAAFPDVRCWRGWWVTIPLTYSRAKIGGYCPSRTEDTVFCKYRVYTW